MRFFAALAVVLFHLGYAVDLWHRAPLLGDLVRPGFSAVSFFYILSGFVLMWSCRTRPPRRFWRERAARLLPLHVAVFTIGALVAIVVMGRAAERSWGLELVLLQAWVPRWGPFASGTSPIPASWSLSCELFFYATAPLAFIVLPRLGATARRMAILVLAGTTIAMAWGSTRGAIPFAFVYRLPPLRLPEFLIGALLALEVASGRLRRIPMGAGVTAAGVGWLVLPHVGQPYGVASCTLVGWMLLIVSIAQQDLDDARPRLHHPLLQALGRSSFALYLTHGLVLRCVTQVLVRAFGVDPVTASLPVSILFVAFVLPLAAAVATFMHLGVEQPLNRVFRGAAGTVTSDRAVAALATPADADAIAPGHASQPLTAPGRS